jgi:hypothetical protein
VKVWIVTAKWGEETDIKSVWLTEQKATEEVKRLEQADGLLPDAYKSDGYYSEEYEVGE